MTYGELFATLEPYPVRTLKLVLSGKLSHMIHVKENDEADYYDLFNIAEYEYKVDFVEHGLSLLHVEREKQRKNVESRRRKVTERDMNCGWVVIPLDIGCLFQVLGRMNIMGNRSISKKNQRSKKKQRRKLVAY